MKQWYALYVFPYFCKLTIYHVYVVYTAQQLQLEQLERLRSENTPAAPWLAILCIHIRSHIITRQSQSYKLQKFAKKLNLRVSQ